MPKPERVTSLDFKRGILKRDGTTRNFCPVSSGLERRARGLGEPGVIMDAERLDLAFSTARCGLTSTFAFVCGSLSCLDRDCASTL